MILKKGMHLVMVGMGFLCLIHAEEATDLTPQIYSLHIRSDIAYRWATTQVTSKLANPGTSAKEAMFRIVLPKAAFIANFSMEIDGIIYPGHVKEKAEAKKTYDDAVRLGHSAGHIQQKTRDSNDFKVSVNVAAKNKVTFHLTYQELLRRRLGVYEHLINVNPGQVVRDMKIDVHVEESREITALKVPPLREDVANTIDFNEVNPIAKVNKISPTKAHVAFHPTVEEQSAASKDGINGQFIMQYDVNRDISAGEIQVVDGYFVHYFAPKGLEPVDKDIVFVLDTSGSMSGTKIKQLKQAMNLILGDLREGDMFNIVEFDSNTKVWREDGLIMADEDNIHAAKAYVNRMSADGGTNINAALLDAIKVLDAKDFNSLNNRPSMIIFLTDGEATSGVTHVNKIMENVRNKNEDRYTIFTLAFGHGADFSFLQKISLQNRGFARKIYEDSDAVLQLENFYNEISTPTLSQVEIKYLDNVIDNSSLTRTIFPTYFEGTELVICGRLLNPASPPTRLVAEIKAIKSEGNIILEASKDIDNGLTVPIDDDANSPSTEGLAKFTEKLWAYQTIKELLKKEVAATDKTEKKELKNKALQLSLKYSFVTPLTSMVVTKPNSKEEGAGLEDTDKISQNYRSQAMGMSMAKYSSQHAYSFPGLPGPVGMTGLRSFGGLMYDPSSQSRPFSPPVRKLHHSVPSFSASASHSKRRKSQGRGGRGRVGPPFPPSIPPRPTFSYSNLPASTTTSTTTPPTQSMGTDEPTSSGAIEPTIAPSTYPIQQGVESSLIISGVKLCVDLDSLHDKYIQLIRCRNNGVTINVKVEVSENATSFTSLGIMTQRSKIIIKPHKIRVYPRGRSIKWSKPSSNNLEEGVKLVVGKDEMITLQVNQILMYITRHGHSVMIKFQNEGMPGKKKVHGIIGQFMQKGKTWKIDEQVGSLNSQLEILDSPSAPPRIVDVSLVRHINVATQTEADCWEPDSPNDILDGQIEDYVIPKLTYKPFSGNHLKHKGKHSRKRHHSRKP
ncbi:unnamed protein product [Owenia fusiformis]|uniref:Uncharacterized protein n=1 Tax=Owenia fusiformis TaxID=6347 RepID=A0A8S4NVK2_OWEFU|nr:unnamed protein product [Owenia fusiformis]